MTSQAELEFYKSIVELLKCVDIAIELLSERIKRLEENEYSRNNEYDLTHTTSENKNTKTIKYINANRRWEEGLIRGD